MFAAVGRGGRGRWAAVEIRRPQSFAFSTSADSLDRYAKLYAPPRWDQGLEGASQPFKELATLRHAIEELNKTNRGVHKREILEEHGDSLRELLLFIYDPHVRMHFRPSGLAKYLNMQKQKNGTFPKHESVESVMDLLRELKSRTVTGHAAVNRIGYFLMQMEEEEKNLKQFKVGSKSLTMREVFFRCLGRNLKAGINSNTIQRVFPESVKQDDERDRSEGEASSAPTTSGSTSSAPAFEVSLGRSATVESMKDRLTGVADQKENEQSWYWSRKLDGVRCIIQVDFDVSQGVGPGLVSVTKVEAYSRNRRLFTALDVLKADLQRHLGACPAVLALLERQKEVAQQDGQESPNELSLFLDGELCALLPAKEGEQGYKEDFPGIAGPLQRKDYTIPNPAYFPFDVLTPVELYEWKKKWGETVADPRQPFYLRKKRVEGLVEYCREAGSVHVRKLDQELVTGWDQIQEAQKVAAENDWEGLIVRQGGMYEGRRSRGIAKIKQWRETEFQVRRVQNAVMRLPVDQRYEEREALASVTIIHKGTEVSVGSGFSVQERLRYGADPSLIIGKDITVRFFAESTNAGTDEISLRFPCVKAVWEEGKRIM